MVLRVQPARFAEALEKRMLGKTILPIARPMTWLVTVFVQSLLSLSSLLSQSLFLLFLGMIAHERLKKGKVGFLCVFVAFLLCGLPFSEQQQHYH
jgi:hypothetical protein